MPIIPAFCERCGAVMSSGIFVENCLNVSLSENRCGPCPNCGGEGRVLDGIFNVSKDLIEVVAAPSWTIERLESLAKTLVMLRKSNVQPEEAAEKLKQESPELAGVADALPKTRMELYAFLTMLLMAVSVLLSQCSREQAGTEIRNEVNIQNVVNQAVEQIQSQRER